MKRHWSGLSKTKSRTVLVAPGSFIVLQIALLGTMEKKLVV